MGSSRKLLLKLQLVADLLLHELNNNLGDECSVNGGDEERLLSKLAPTFS